MGLFLRVAFGTVVAVVTAALLLIGVAAAYQEEWEVVRSAGLLWGLMAGAVFVSWLLWLAGRWTIARFRRAEKAVS